MDVQKEFYLYSRYVIFNFRSLRTYNNE